MARKSRMDGPLPALPPGGGVERPERLIRGVLLAVALVTFCVFLPSLRGQFAWDDTPNFVQNPSFRGLGLQNLRWMFVGSFHKGNYEPLNWLLMGLVYALGGMNPKAYHLAGLLLHSAAAGLFFLLARRLFVIALQPGREQDRQVTMCSALSALLFSLHPLRAEVVAWVSGLHYSLATVSYMACILFYLSAHETGSRRYLVLSAASFAVSLLSFPIGMMLPAVLLLLDVYPLRRLAAQDGAWRSALRRVLIEKIPFVLLLAAGAGVMLASRVATGNVAGAEGHGSVARVLVAMYGAIFYVWKTVIPLRLSGFYEMPRNVSVGDWPFNLSTAAFTAFSAGMYVCRRRFPAALAAWAYQIVVLLPVSGLAQSGPQIAADRYAYLACLGWPLVLGAAVFRGLERHGSLLKSVAMLAPAPALLGLGVLAWRQAGTWENDETLWKHVLRVNPAHISAHFNLGRALDEQGRTEEAIRHYKAAAENDPASLNPHFNLGVVYKREGRLDEAAAEFGAVIRLSPGYAPGRYFLAATLEKQGKVPQAILEYLKAVESDPEYAPAHRRLGVLLQRQGRSAEAAGHYASALKSDPENAFLHNNLGIILAAAGRLDEAVAHFRSALASSPDRVEYHLNLAGALRLSKDYDGAIAGYRQALSLDPGNEQARRDLAVVLSLRTRRSVP